MMRALVLITGGIALLWEGCVARTGWHWLIVNLIEISIVTGMPLCAAAAQDESMSGMQMEEHAESQLPSPHAGSGTGWQPASVPGYEWMWMEKDPVSRKGGDTWGTRVFGNGWMVMAHGVIFIDYN